YVPRTRQNSSEVRPRGGGEHDFSETTPAGRESSRDLSRGQAETPKRAAPGHGARGRRTPRERVDPADTGTLRPVYCLGGRLRHGAHREGRRTPLPAAAGQPSNRLGTQPSQNTSLIARASSGARDGCVGYAIRRTE